MPRIYPPQTKYKNQKDYIKHCFDTAFTVSDEAFGLLVLDYKPQGWNQQFEAKLEGQIHGPEYQKKDIDLFQKRPSGWSDKAKPIYYTFKKTADGAQEYKTRVNRKNYANDLVFPT